MIVTMAHLHWYQERKLPSWLGKVQAPKRVGGQRQLKVEELITKTTIHDLINLQVTKVGYPHDPKAKKLVDHELHNLISLLKLARSDGEDLPVYLQHLLEVSWTGKARVILVTRILRHLRRAS